MRESDILFTVGRHWVLRAKADYTVYRNSDSGTHATADSSYAKTPDGLSLAIARAAYLATGKSLARESLGYATHVLNDSDYRPEWRDAESFLADAAKMRAAYDARLKAANDVARDFASVGCTYHNCKCIVQTSTSQPEPICPKGLST